MGFFDYFRDFFRDTTAARHLTVTDVTRMAGDAVCIAALDGAKAVRLSTPQPRDGWLESVGGLAPGDQVSVTWRPEKRYKPPHMEDGRWIPSSIAKVGQISHDDLTMRLSAQSFPSVTEAFGWPAFQSPRGNPAFRPGRGSRSLATLRVKRVLVRPVAHGVRADFVDEERVWKMVPVEDLAIRAHQETCRSCKGEGFAENLTAELGSGEALLRIGLGRPFRSNSDTGVGCYLQVNHIIPLGSNAGSHFVLT